MRALAAISLIALGLAAVTAQAQPTDGSTPAAPALPPAIAVPPAPAMIAAPPSIQPIPAPASPPPGLVPATPPADIDTGGSATTPDQTAPDQTQSTDGSAAPGQPAPDATIQDIAPIPPNTWLPGKTATIGVLDKVDGSVSKLSIPVGGNSVVGDLQVNVQACMTRPPDQVPDAAVFLALQNAKDQSAPPNYRGWLIRSAPGAAVAGDASETFRIIDCS